MNPSRDCAGVLWVVATPIGNLGDVSQRARETLAGADVVAAEDTRAARRLLSALGLSRPLVSLHEHNEDRVAGQLLDRVAGGEVVALISDAGTPLVSDPGYRLVDGARERDLDVRPVPGPCAAIAALSVAGLPSDRFWFEGFLPPRSAARRSRLEALSRLSVTMIFYETGRRLPEVLADMEQVLGSSRPVVLARELTKAFETVRRGSFRSLSEWVAADADQRRGEMVVLVGGAEADSPEIPVERLARELAGELPPARAARLLARLTGMKRAEAWDVVEARRRPDES